MGYLICNECGGYYKLQKGESPKNFTGICECGGNLRYAQNLDDHEVNDPKPKNRFNVKKIAIVVVCFLILAVFGISQFASFNGLNTEKHTVSNSTFQIPIGWDSPGIEYELFYEHFSEAAYFTYGDYDMELLVEQYPHEEFKFSLESAKETNEGSKSKIMDISGIKVTLVQYSSYSPGRDMNGTIYEYYFQKNGKSFSVKIDDYRAKKDQRNQKFITDTIKTIIATIK